MRRTVFIVSALMSFSVYAANEGWKNCDDDGVANCEYQIKDGVLTIRPQDNSQPASIPDYERDCTQTRYSECTTTAPWKWDENVNTITSLKIENGMTSIGYDAFEDMPFTVATLPEGLKSIASLAFLESTALKEINLPKSLESIGSLSFAGGVILKNAVIPNVTTVGGSAFGYRTESVVVGENTNLDIDVFTYYSGVGTQIRFDNFTLYCPESNTSCQLALQKALSWNKEYASKPISDFLKTYTKDEQTGLYQTEDGKLFASLDLMAHGAACTDKKNCEDILNSNGNPFKVGSKVYNSLADFANGNYVKHRIYTIEEANFVAGDKNRVSIKYR